MSLATLCKKSAALGGVVVLAFGIAAHAAEVELKVQSALPKKHDLTASFLDLYVDKVNKVGKGVVHINYIGGPEVTPANKAAQALERGVIDMLHSPAAYYVGIIPHGLATMATNRTPAELRANGGFDMLEKVWEKKLHAKIVAWGESGAQFHLYTVPKPKVDKDGMIDLHGVKMRTTGAYRSLCDALGATNVSIAAPEVFTGLERGVIDGFGWPTVGLKALGLAKAVKYRIDPPFYHLANLVLINLDKWKSLSPQVQNVLLKVGREYEETSTRRMQEAAKVDEQAVRAAGVQIFEQTGAARKKYLRTAYGAMWGRIEEKLGPQETAALRAKMYREE